MADTELCGTRGQAHQYSKSMSINASSTLMLVNKWASSKGRAFSHHIITESISDWPDEPYEPQAPSLVWSALWSLASVARYRTLPLSQLLLV